MNSSRDEMQALQMDQYIEDPFAAILQLSVVKKPIPVPSRGEVLVKVEAAPCNPSDILFLQGHYGIKKTLPAIPGWEGAGTVVRSGPGLWGRWLIGKRVAFSVQKDAGGTWAQYCVVDAKACITLNEDTTFEEGASLIINPLTALGLVERAQKEGHKAIIQTAAASQVGRMVLALANEKGLPSIHIVRRKEQEELLRTLGAKIILNSEEAGFEKALKNEAERLQATLAFDAVAGTMTGLLLHSMPPRSTVLVYGGLSGAYCSEISPQGLIFHEKTLTGFYLSTWIKQQWIWDLYRWTQLVQKLIARKTFHTQVSCAVSLNEAKVALVSYQKAMTSGKVLIMPQKT